MKSVLFAFLAAVTLAACGKKEEVPAPASIAAPTPASATPATPVASEPAKTDEAKK